MRQSMCQNGEFVCELCPLFCLVKLMRKTHFWGKVQDGVYSSIKKNFIWKRAEEDPDWRPDPADLEHADKVLETCYYYRELRTEKDDADASKVQDGIKKRRALGQK